VGLARHRLEPPISTAALPTRQYAHDVAADVENERFDLLHVHHTTQVLPALRRAAPRARIVLHLHAEWFPQSPRSAIARRLRHADAVICCSAYVAQQVTRYPPAIGARCFVLHNGVARLGPGLASRVSFTGRISASELLDHYLSASVFAFPSLWPEGFGLPPVEAMAAGVAVVASRIGALSETTVDGETGYLVVVASRLRAIYEQVPGRT
jgi:glycosyltransferase involved in cell wall biosynthesis